ncbi:hypothetical protein [Nereida sp. MMG025]|uniref:hypothetical protein n=1 Tax=Nereida sp. MMG025 TaxID=2909981 RepID=UPI001F3E1CE9|nr:hypothetical protein [Nereida sp. MMG025]MCF6443167.1 hypothetical protein [Nereida sp. MMG025]
MSARPFHRIARHICLILAIGLGVSACGRLAESRVNPVNWFDRERPERVQPLVEDISVEIDPRPLVQDVSQLTIERVAGGAIVRATGVPQSQAFYEAELVEVESDDPTTLTYEFRVIPPRAGAPVGSQASREIIVGQFATDQQLQNVRIIRVLGSNTARSVRR